MKRRKFISSSLSLAATGTLLKGFQPSRDYDSSEEEIREFLGHILYAREEVDGWFAGKMFPFSKYQSEFGWLLQDAKFRDGINNSWSVYTYRQPEGERAMSNYSSKPCRINCYGDSFTQCHQVSDHETWEEILAAHIQEPVRNFGIGGWSSYQAYLRMLKEEQLTPAELIIFNIYDDDHLRNLDSWRNIRVRKHPQHIEATLPYLKVDMKNSRIIPCQNPCPRPQDYYKLCDPEQAFRLFREDFVLRIMIAHEKSSDPNPSGQYQQLRNLSLTHGIDTGIDESATLSSNADRMHREAAIFSGCRLVSLIMDHARINNKKVLFVLSYPAPYIANHFATGKRWDQKFIDFLKAAGIDFVDLSQEHLDDFKSCKTDIDTYLARLFIGHYNPAGNFFCAHALRDKVVERLDPKPLPYAGAG